MKRTSVVRQCLFNSPQWLWYATAYRTLYPKVYNVVKVSQRGLEDYLINISVPSEFYMVMKKQGISEVFGFRLDGRMFIADTDKGELKLWVYSKLPKWAVIL